MLPWWEAVKCGCGQDVGVALISTANVGYGMGEVDRKWSMLLIPHRELVHSAKV